MANKPKKRKIRYFYVKVEDSLHLHRVLHVDRPQDLVTAWDYIDAKRKMYSWASVQKTMQNTFTMSEAAEILGVHRMTVVRYIDAGQIRTPQRVYNLGTRKPGKYLLSADDVLDLHQAMAETHGGRPRQDGLVTRNNIPPRSVVKTLVSKGEVLYTKNEAGEFIPIWKEQVW